MDVGTKKKIAEVGNILPELVHLHLPRGEQVVGRKMGDPQSPQHELKCAPLISLGVA
jgi:hypothetical protein